MRAFIPTIVTLVVSSVASICAFAPTLSQKRSSSALQANDEKQFSFPNPVAEIGDMFSSLDDVIDDFFNKRMGKGEIFYGKRKYKPSGDVESDYSGYGFSDRRKIDAAREFREERARNREEREEAQKEYDLLHRKEY